MAWEFKREESNKSFDLVPVGDHRIRVKSAEMAVSKSGNDMITLQFEVSGYNATLYHYIVFMADKPEITNRMLTAFYDSFKDIPEGDNHIAQWVGKVGACHVKHEEYNGNMQAKIHYFIKADKQGDLEPWKEPMIDSPKGGSANGSDSGAGFVNVPAGIDEEVPF